VYNWNADYTQSQGPRYLNLILFSAAAISALVIFLIFHPDIVEITQQTPILINLMFIPALGIGFLYGMKISERAIKPTEIRSPFRRSIVKLFLFFFIIGGLFSSINFALNGGTLMPTMSILEDGLIDWLGNFVSQNGSITFLIISSITIMASATKRIVGLGGTFNKLITFVGTFTFFSMISLSLTHNDPTHSEVYLYAFYQSGIIGGALYQMNKLTRNLNFWENFANGNE